MSPMELPARIGKYELQQFLGGGMSEVYRAQDTLLGRTVAVKLLTDEGCRDPEAKARFLHEARIASNIVHENIISIFDFGEEQGRPYMVMEHVAGESLRDAIRNGRAGDLRKKLGIALEISRALECIHGHNIIHRDVKPDNIFVTASGKARLMDFGIAKAQGIALTRVGFTLGTPYYMAPEQVRGQQVTHLVDVYAFGVLLFELLSGEKPIAGDAIETIFDQILNHPLNLEPLKAANPPPAVFKLVGNCMAKSAAGRIQSFTLIASEIERILENPAATAAPVLQAGGSAAAPARATAPQAAKTAAPAASGGAMAGILSSQTVQAVLTAVIVLAVLTLLYLGWTALRR